MVPEPLYQLSLLVSALGHPSCHKGYVFPTPDLQEVPRLDVL